MLHYFSPLQCVLHALRISFSFFVHRNKRLDGKF
jgi:hypothetical protein